MTGRAPQKPPKSARQITLDSPETGRQVYEWMTANGFPFHIPADAELHLSRDGRTLYGEKFLVRISRSGDHSRVPRWDYQTNRAGDDLTRKRFAYPIIRPLSWYAPDLAERLHLP